MAKKPERAEPDGDSAVLTLTTKEDRGVVRIEGVTYDLAVVSDLSINDRIELNRAIARMRLIEDKKRRSTADQREYDARLDWMCRTALPKAPIEKLPKDQKELLVAHFFARVAKRNGRAAVLEQLGLLKRSTISSSSRASKRSTAGIRRAG